MRRWSISERIFQRFPLASISVFLFVCYGFVRLAEWGTLDWNEHHYESALDNRCSAYLDAATQEFLSLQASLFHTAKDAAALSPVETVLQGGDSSRAVLFGEFDRISRSGDIGIELFDGKGELLVWSGRSGTGHRREVRAALDGQVLSFVNQLPTASQLYVALPVRVKGPAIGAVVVRRVVDNDVPLNNRYFRREGLTHELGRRLGATVEFNFSPAAESRKDGRYTSRILYGVDSTRLGVVSVLRPTRNAFLDTESFPFETIGTIILTLVAGILLFASLRSLRIRVLFAPVSVVASACVLWTFRYALLRLDSTSVVGQIQLFDPALFASQFGGGLARSIGAMTISVAVLVATVAITIDRLTGYVSRVTIPEKMGGNPLIRFCLSLLVFLLLYGLLRAFGAMARSVVFDSTLQFNDPREIFPSFELAVLVLDLLVTAACLILIASAIAYFLIHLMSPKTGTTWTARGIVAAAALVDAWAFDLLQETPLMEPWHRLVFGLLVMGIAEMNFRRRTAGVRLVALRSGAAVFLCAAVIDYLLVDLNVREKDRGQIEVFAEEGVRPVDSWLTFIVEDGQRHLAAEDAAEVLIRGDAEQIGRLAFSGWAQSVACKEGLTSLFAVTDTLGNVVSRFVIGGQSQLVLDADTALAHILHGAFPLRVVGGGIAAVRVYGGAMPIRSDEGTLLGYGIVEIARGHQALFRGENPAVLRSGGQGDMYSFYRPLSATEFSDSVVSVTTNPDIPVGYRVPPAALAGLSKTESRWTWIEESIGENSYETLYLRRPDAEDTIVALGLRMPGFGWHLMGIVRLLTFCLIILCAWALVTLVLRRARGLTLFPTFRDRLLGALLVTALVPLGLLSLYGQYYSRERLMQTTSARLSEHTTAVSQNLPDSLFASAGKLTPALAEQIASDVGTDFNVFAGGQMVLTSRPELFEAGILDSRLSGGAYRAAYLQGKRFFLENERIGAFEYAVGYSPVVSEGGKILAVVSVPTVFRQDELETELAGRNAFILGVYLAVIGALLIIATIFASRIAAPIHRLTHATRRVANGDLDIHLGDVRTPGEIGELVSSFEHMTAEIKRNREELARRERELAWKEMARQVAHEIKNPLTPMRLAVQHLRMVFREGSGDFSAVLQEVTTTLLNQIDTLSRIASEFSHFGRMPQPHLSACDVNNLLEETALLFSREGDVLVSLDLDRSLPPVFADRDELRRAFANIFRNAVQAMNNVGSVKVSTSFEGRVKVRIADSGPGIPEEIRDRLFQPNFSTKTEGMGLGLAMVKKTIDDLAGSIHIESEAGKGAVVVIEIPPAAGQKQQEPSEA